MAMSLLWVLVMEMAVAVVTVPHCLILHGCFSGRSHLITREIKRLSLITPNRKGPNR